MNKIDMLLVRACKSRRPRSRLRSVYRRFFAVSRNGDELERDFRFNMTGLLADIVDDHFPMSIRRFISACGEIRNRRDFWKYKGSDPAELSALMSYIRFLDNDAAYRDCVKPLYWRNREKEMECRTE